MAARRRRSDVGQLRQNFQAKNEILQFLSYINVMYLKRIFHVEFKFEQKQYGSLLKNLKKFEFFCFWVKNEADQVSSMASFSNFLTTKLKNGFARSC